MERKDFLTFFKVARILEELDIKIVDWNFGSLEIEWRNGHRVWLKDLEAANELLVEYWQAYGEGG